MSELAEGRPLVVGVNGTPGSLTALRWAVNQARLLRVPLVVVHAWEPSAGLRAPYAPAASCRTVAEDRARAVRVLDAAVSTVLGPPPHIGIRAELAEGAPAAVLLRQADKALLLVLGRHTPHENTVARLGPVTRDCARQAACPVVTVPESANAAWQDTSSPTAGETVGAAG